MICRHMKTEQVQVLSATNKLYNKLYGFMELNLCTIYMVLLQLIKQNSRFLTHTTAIPDNINTFVCFKPLICSKIPTQLNLLC